MKKLVENYMVFCGTTTKNPARAGEERAAVRDYLVSGEGRIRRIRMGFEENDNSS